MTFWVWLITSFQKARVETSLFQDNILDGTLDNETPNGDMVLMIIMMMMIMMMKMLLMIIIGIMVVITIMIIMMITITIMIMIMAVKQ